MYGNDFEKAFTDFLGRPEYDQAEKALFTMIRIAFAAGWKAAGEDPPKPPDIFYMIRKKGIDRGRSPGKT